MGHKICHCFYYLGQKRYSDILLDKVQIVQCALWGQQQSTIIYTSVGGRSRKNSAPTGSGGGGEVITGNKVLKPVAWDQLGSAWILAQYAPTTPFTCTDVGTGNPCIWISSHSLPQRLQCSGHFEFSLSNARFITHHICVQLSHILGNILDSTCFSSILLSLSLIKKVHDGSG